MSALQRSGSIESNSVSNERKRVCKACDRCRMKKSKCDGQSPCSRCQANNAICVFGERKKTYNKKYPDGYTEILEQQQAQLVACVRKMYTMLLNGDSWPREPLKIVYGDQPLTHDILARLDLLEIKGEGEITQDGIEDNQASLRRRAELADMRQSKCHRRSQSLNSHSDLGHHTPPSTGSPINQGCHIGGLARKAQDPLTPTNTTSLQSFSLPSSFKDEAPMPFYGEDIPLQVYMEQMNNASGLPLAYKQFSNVDPMFAMSDQGISPNMTMPQWKDFQSIDFIDMGLPLLSNSPLNLQET